MRRIRPITTLAAAAVTAILALAALPAAASAGPALTAADEAAYAKTNANIRSEPTRASTTLQELRSGERVYVSCWVAGEPTYGTDKYGSMWLSVDSNGTFGYVHSYLLTPVAVPHC